MSESISIHLDEAVQLYNHARTEIEEIKSTAVAEFRRAKASFEANNLGHLVVLADEAIQRLEGLNISEARLK